MPIALMETERDIFRRAGTQLSAEDPVKQISRTSCWRALSQRSRASGDLTPKETSEQITLVCTPRAVFAARREPRHIGGSGGVWHAARALERVDHETPVTVPDSSVS
jgi:hypothetical protein